jgi:cyclophilin family peptidyl-prolyl cis-trans isomerase
VFGEVTRGHEVVRAIENVRTDENSKPLMDIKIKGVKVLEAKKD